MSATFHQLEPLSHRPKPPSQTPFFAFVASQNQQQLIPLLIESDNQINGRITASALYHFTEPLPPLPVGRDVPRESAKITVKVVPADSLDCAEDLQCEGKLDIVVLNMANAWTPGGAYLMGAGAQEESLCRRTSLYRSLSGRDKGFYPIPTRGAIYSPNVLVLRKSDAEGCAILDPHQRWWTSVISVAAIANPRLKPSGRGYARKEEKLDMTEKIRSLLRIAALENKKNLVLGALGCGAFRNPPHSVAKMFKAVLGEAEFTGRFEGIWFSVIERSGSENYKIFKDTLDGMQI